VTINIASGYIVSNNRGFRNSIKSIGEISSLITGPIG